PGDLMTGQILKFRAEQAGYYPEIFSLKIAPYQTELVLRANLVPLPGALSLEAPEASYRIFLNGSETIVRGGELMVRESLEGYSGGTRTWDLPSGRYDLEIISGEKILQTRLDIVPGETTRLTVRESDGMLLLYKE
ncbi:MAG TPA: serine/threonine protein kinase, partial [Treponemataceae bacterium]|nr:serine/threonine protein kinase [Treponemataceae bacterium]